MEQLILKVKKRELVGKRQSSLRKQGRVPANLYGFEIKNINLEVDSLLFSKFFAKAGKNTIFELRIEEEKPLKVLVRDIQYDPISGNFLHIDFLQVNDKRKLKTKIKINFTGEAPAIKEKGGSLVTGVDNISVITFPSDLLSEIMVDLGSLDDLGKSIRVKDLDLPEGMTILSNPFDTVASVLLSRGARKALLAGGASTDVVEEKPQEEVAKK